MRVGLAFDLKDALSAIPPGAPEDAHEEYDSIETVSLITSSLMGLGHQVVPLGGGVVFLQNIQAEKGLDIVFNISEGRGTHPAREAQVPAVLEMLDIPYTGSAPECLALCLDKPLTKILLKAAGIYTPGWTTINNADELKNITWKDFRFPMVAKPAHEGSSIGIHADSLVSTVSEAMLISKKLLSAYHQPVMLEEYITGDEVTVGILGNSPSRVLGIMRIIPRHKNLNFMYTVEVKRDYKNQVDYECPAMLDITVVQKIEEAALKAFRVLGCRDLSRLDFKIAKDGTPYLLEINPLPGLGDHSDLVIMAQKLSLNHTQLIDVVLSSALNRYPQCIKQ